MHHTYQWEWEMTFLYSCPQILCGELFQTNHLSVKPTVRIKAELGEFRLLTEVNFFSLWNAVKPQAVVYIFEAVPVIILIINMNVCMHNHHHHHYHHHHHHHQGGAISICFRYIPPVAATKTSLSSSLAQLLCADNTSQPSSRLLPTKCTDHGGGLVDPSDVLGHFLTKDHSELLASSL